MTFKFLNFYVLNLAKPVKNTLKTSLHYQDLNKHMKSKRTDVHYVMSLCCLHYDELMPRERFKTEKFTPPNSTFLRLRCFSNVAIATSTLL